MADTSRTFGASEYVLKRRERHRAKRARATRYFRPKMETQDGVVYAVFPWTTPTTAYRVTERGWRRAPVVSG